VWGQVKCPLLEVLHVDIIQPQEYKINNRHGQRWLYLTFAKLCCTVVSQRLYFTSVIHYFLPFVLRLWQSGSLVATFKHHTLLVTTVEWQLTEAPVCVWRL
jgi:hypothetical protein